MPPFDDPLVIAGQGTIGLETRRARRRDGEVVIVPVGGGGLIAGVATALTTLAPEARVVGVEAAGAASMLAAIARGRTRCSCSRSTTMADGIAVGAVSELTSQHVEAFVDEVVTVDEEEISRAVLFLLERGEVGRRAGRRRRGGGAARREGRRGRHRRSPSSRAATSTRCCSRG